MVAGPVDSQAMTAALQRENAIGRQDIVEAIGKFWPNAKELIALLIRALNDDDAQVRERAIQVLLRTHVSGDRIAAAFLKALENETVVEPRASAAGNVSQEAMRLLMTWAVDNGRQELVGRLIEKGADVNAGNPILRAARHGHLRVVRLLVEKGADVNVKVYGNGRTALGWAKSKDHQDIVKLLIAHGAR